MASLGGAWTGLRNNAVLQQIFLYSLVGQLVSGALSSYFQSVQQESLSRNPTTVLSPQEAATAVLRQIMPHDAAAAEALLSGVNGQRFDVMTQLVGQAPGPGDLAVALRRKIIDQQTYDRGIAQGNLRNEWGPIIQKLSVVQPSPQAMLEAELEGQLGHAEALQRYQQLGGDPDYYQILFDTQGQAPTPVQALEMANRGIIPWTGTGPAATSFQQAFLEGPWRNKWLDSFQKLGVYLPPPRTVTAMLRAGSIDAKQAATWLSGQGLDKTAVAAYIQDATEQKTSGTKQLAQSTILALYHDRLINRTNASTYLQDLGYDSQEADLVLNVADAQLAQRFLGLAVGRVHSRYIGWRIGRTDAVTALSGLGVDATGQSDLLASWDIERTANTPTLTPSQIAKAWHVGIMAQAEAVTRLTEHGYSDVDAWLFLSQYQGAPAPNPPAGYKGP